jgi:hypothetical protein
MKAGVKERIEAILSEAAKARRAWEGRLKHIDGLMAWMYDKDILTKGEKKDKDRIFNAYYRFYNDGDIPGFLKKQGFGQWAMDSDVQREKMERALEDYLEAFVRKILGKYITKVDRTEFRYDQMIDTINTIRRVIERDDAHGLVTFWYEKLHKKDASHVLSRIDDLRVSYSSLEKEVGKACDAYEWENSYDNPKNKVMTYAKQEMEKVGIWEPRFEKMWIEVRKQMVGIRELVDNLLAAAQKAKSLHLLDRQLDRKITKMVD